MNESAVIVSFSPILGLWFALCINTDYVIIIRLSNAPEIKEVTFTWNRVMCYFIDGVCYGAPGNPFVSVILVESRNNGGVVLVRLRRGSVARDSKEIRFICLKELFQRQCKRCPA